MTESNESEKLKREQIVMAALSAINGDRDLQYGTPENSFTEIAKLWSAYLDMQITPEQTAIMMALFKIARIKTGVNKDDNFIDGCGYMAIAAELAEGSEVNDDFYKIKRKRGNMAGFDVWNYFRTYKRHKDVTDAAFDLPTNLSYNMFKERLTPELKAFLDKKREV